MTNIVEILNEDFINNIDMLENRLDYICNQCAHILYDEFRVDCDVERYPLALRLKELMKTNSLTLTFLNSYTSYGQNYDISFSLDLFLLENLQRVKLKLIKKSGSDFELIFDESEQYFEEV